jgi:hypothetical protein
VHADLDAQDRPLVGAGLDRVVERAARRPVDRALVAAGVGQTLLERLDFVGAHLRRIEARCAGGCKIPNRGAANRPDRGKTTPEGAQFNHLCLRRPCG